MAAPAEYLNRPPLALTQQDRETMVALMLMDEWGDRDDGPAPHIEYAVEWFTRIEPMMQGPHQGDCTNYPMTCTRCLLEDYADMAMKIRTALSKTPTGT